jgi:hypothetical protein
MSLMPKFYIILQRFRSSPNLCNLSEIRPTPILHNGSMGTNTGRDLLSYSVFYLSKLDSHSLNLLGTHFIMTFTRNLVSMAVLSAATVLGQVGSAQAFSFDMTTGIAGPNGVTNQGAYSDFSGKSTVKTIDFNSGVIPTTGFATYSFQNNSGASSVRTDKWAPAGANGEVNTGKYLAVFQGDSLEIKLASTVNYFGMDLGAISSGNTLSFYRGTTLIKTYNTADMNARATVSASQHGGQENGYGHFYADNANERFDRMVISQVGGGGFETDNHSFNMGGNDVRKTPEPGMMLGLVAIGGSVWAKRKQRG